MKKGILKCSSDVNYSWGLSILMVMLFFQSGEPILTIYESLAFGVLGLPRALNSENCLDTNPAGILHYLDQCFFSCIIAHRLK